MIVGKALDDGNIVKLQYVVTNRELANVRVHLH